jgi:hypothetical protein
LRAKHGELEVGRRNRFGFGSDSLTESEARYLERTENADTIRSRIASVEQARNSQASEGRVRGAHLIFAEPVRRASSAYRRTVAATLMAQR